MTVPAAFAGVILIWTTTPLAVQWSGQDVGFLFGVTARMTLAAMLIGLLLRPLRVRLPWHRRARSVYLASGLGIYLAMIAVYWAAQQIPSGWISVLFGLTPLATGLLARLWLGERDFGWTRLLGVGVALLGLLVMFAQAAQLGPGVILGVMAMLFSVLAHSASAVWVKRHGHRIPALAVTTGGLYIAAPLLLLTWFFSGQGWPATVSGRTAFAIIYLSVVATVLGFALFYYVLHRLGPVRISLVTLVTPVLALLLGHLANDEPLSAGIWLGVALVLSGLLFFEWAALQRLLRGRPGTDAGALPRASLD
jgi:drug/metabolite transporter (DMT)-like permease